MYSHWWWKWIHYDNPKKRKSWEPPGHASTSIAKPNIFMEKNSCCVFSGISLVSCIMSCSNRTRPLLGLSTEHNSWDWALKEKRAHYYSRHDKIILLHNARSHVATPVKIYLETLKWKVLPYPPYSPNIAPSDYHLFRLMTHGLSEQHFTSYEDIKNCIDDWIASKDEAYFRRGIHILPEKWEKVVASDDHYFK